MKKILYCISILFLTSIPLSSCSGSSDKTDPADSTCIVEPIDSPAFKLGEKHAIELLNDCRTTNELRDRLLDLRAREHIIRTQIRTTAADAYIKGIESKLKESGDTLAAAIL